ncbi:MAG: hypothetical protein AAB553_00030 [Patescibacteria group bacterium]
MIKKQLLVPVIGLTLAGATFLGIGSAYAQSTDTQNYPTIVQKIADKFGLNPSEVQTVFKEHHEERRVEMQSKMEEKLTQAVTDGKITAEQKEAILKKFQELHDKKEANMDKLKDMTPEERKETFESEKQELEKWAEENNIDMKSLMPFGGFGMKMKIMHGE